jgi:RimJ/RimL family protein N-acetyltransferase
MRAGALIAVVADAGALATETLRLEPLTVAHADEMFEPMSAPQIYAWIPGAPPVSLDALRRRYAALARGHSADGRERWLNWIVRLDTGCCAGYVQATVHPTRTADFAFVFAPRHWGRGIAHEASSAALGALAREHGVTAVYATVDPANARSSRLLERLGFAAIAPDAYPHGEVTAGDLVYARVQAPPPA